MNLFIKVILPLLGITLWLLVSWSLVMCFSEELNLLSLWIVAGCPFGIMRMRHWLVPTSAASMAQGVMILLLDLIVGGLIGGFVLVSKIIKIIANIVRFVTHEEME